EGLDPIAAIAREEAATVAFHEREIEMLRSHGDRKVEIALAEQQIKQAHHKADLARIAAETRAREAALQKQKRIAEVVFSLGNQSMALGEEIAVANAASEGQRTAMLQGFAASRATVTGI